MKYNEIKTIEQLNKWVVDKKKVFDLKLIKFIDNHKLELDKLDYQYFNKLGELKDE